MALLKSQEMCPVIGMLLVLHFKHHFNKDKVVKKAEERHSTLSLLELINDNSEQQDLEHM